MSIETVDNAEAVDGSEVHSTLLGPVFMLPKAGVIRPGIKVLKKGCSEKDQKTYNELLSQGATWDEIARAIGNDEKGRTKLIPSNADYFTIRPQDCKNSDDARRLHDLYADEDGKIRSLPVWFSVNEWYNIIPHGLRAFGKQSLRYYSEIEENGNGFRRVCRFPLEIKSGQRIYGGRKYVQRPCDPDNCQEYQKSECNFGGVIRCHIPGVKGIGSWLIPTTSWYSLSNIKSTLEIVAKLTRGRIAGLVESDPSSPTKVRTLFRLRKTPDEVSMISNGRPQRVEQDLIYLDVDIDLTLLAVQYNTQALLAAGAESLKLLNGSSESRKSVPAPVNEVSRQPESSTGSSDNGDILESVPESEPAKPRKLSQKAKKLFEVLSNQYQSSEDLQRFLVKMTGKKSFYDLTDEEAQKVIDRCKGNGGNTPGEGDIPKEVQELKDILDAIASSTEDLHKRLQELTGCSSFSELTKEKAVKAIEELSATSMTEF